jgi:hypothetical protein
MRGGMGLEGGLFVVVGSMGAIPIEYGLVEGVQIAEARGLQARGSVLGSVVADRRSPITYGFEDKLALYFSGAPVLNLSTGFGFGGRGGGGGGGFGGFGAAQAGGRPTGRGGANDPDVPQGRPLFEAPARPPRGEEDDGIPQEFREQARNQLPPEEQRARVILRWAPEKDLLVSGMLAGGAELAGKAAVVDAPLGKGHILFFANNPFWRMETSGSYMLLFNAAMNFDNLTPRRAQREPSSGGEDK